MLKKITESIEMNRYTYLTVQPMPTGHLNNHIPHNSEKSYISVIMLY